ncbi:GxxExxY protein [Planctomycetota bacterium]
MDDEVSEAVIGAAFAVHNQLGFGFLESVCQNALSIELTKNGIRHAQETPIRVWYDEHVVGEFKADFLVEDSLIVELKSVTEIAVAHEVQLVNYLAATRIEAGLLINFGPTKVDVKRKF